MWRLKKICTILHISSKYLRQFEPFAACLFFDFRKPHLAHASFSGLAAVRLRLDGVNFHLCALNSALFCCSASVGHKLDGLRSIQSGAEALLLAAVVQHCPLPRHLPSRRQRRRQRPTWRFCQHQMMNAINIRTVYIVYIIT